MNRQFSPQQQHAACILLLWELSTHCSCTRLPQKSSENRNRCRECITIPVRSKRIHANAIYNLGLMKYSAPLSVIPRMRHDWAQAVSLRVKHVQFMLIPCKEISNGCNEHIQLPRELNVLALYHTYNIRAVWHCGYQSKATGKRTCTPSRA